MSFPSSSSALSTVLAQLQNYCTGIKSSASAAIATLLANNVNTAYIFSMLDQLSAVISGLNSYITVSGLNTYATANIPGYAGTLTTDITAVINAAQACIDWIVAMFPTDASTHTWLLAYKLNSDGTRTMASFTPAQTAGLRTALSTLVASIG